MVEIEEENGAMMKARSSSEFTRKMDLSERRERARIAVVL